MDVYQLSAFYNNNEPLFSRYDSLVKERCKLQLQIDKILSKYGDRLDYNHLDRKVWSDYRALVDQHSKLSSEITKAYYYLRRYAIRNTK